MTKDEAMRLALEALENNRYIIETEINPPEALEEVDVAIAVLRQALEQPSQDLIVGYADAHDLTRDGHDFWVSRQPGKNTVPLYLYGHPPKIWQGLTEEEALALVAYSHPLMNKLSVAHAIEAKLKGKNNG